MRDLRTHARARPNANVTTIHVWHALAHGARLCVQKGNPLDARNYDELSVSCAYVS